MASLVKQFKTDILSQAKRVTDLLRTAKLISAKLELPDIENWIAHELGGYPDDAEVPKYREAGVILQAFNPYRGWITVSGDQLPDMPFRHSMAALEELSSQETVAFQPKHKVPLSDGLSSSFQQRFVLAGTTFKAMAEAVRDRLLDWTIEMEKRGITGEDMSFDAEEKKIAQSQTFNIQNFSGIIGNVSDFSVALYDYRSIHQILKESGVSQSERNELENLMDSLKDSTERNSKSLVERAKQWFIKNEPFLGAGASLVRKALGLDSPSS